MKVTLETIKPTTNNLELILAWRSSPLIYEGNFFMQKEPLNWEGNYNWWKANSTKSRLSFFIVLKNRRIGVIGIHELDTDTPEIDIYIGEVTLWGLGVGKLALKQVLRLLRVYGHKKVFARILENNLRSQGLFKSVGFKEKGKSREGELLFRKDLR